MRDAPEDQRRDLFWLFVGGFAQWCLATLCGRWAVNQMVAAVFFVTLTQQTLWWVNIQQTTKRNGIARWAAWAFGAASGAALGAWL